MRLPRRQWAWILDFAHPNGYTEHEVGWTRYWTERGAQLAADEYAEMMRADDPEMATYARFSVAKVGPVKWDDDLD